MNEQSSRLFIIAIFVLGFFIVAEGIGLLFNLDGYKPKYQTTASVSDKEILHGTNIACPLSYQLPYKYYRCLLNLESSDL